MDCRFLEQSIVVLMNIFLVLLLLVIFLETCSLYLSNAGEAQAEVHFKSTTQFNEAKHFSESERCGSLAEKHYLSCFGSIGNSHWDSSRLWKPTVMSQYFGSVQMKADCEYSFEFATARRYTSENMEFSEHIYVIKQSGCMTPNLPLGGTTFHIWATSRHHHISCVTEDQFDGTYIVSCPFPCLYGGKSCLDAREGGADCREVTALVEFEHYDSYLDAIPALCMTTKYPPIRKMLANNRTLCAGSTAQEVPKAVQSYLARRDALAKPSSASLYTGVWVNKDIAADVVLIDKSPFMPAYALQQKHKSIHNYAVELAHPELAATLPSVAVLKEPEMLLLTNQ
jgi:hypothetical protein